MPSFQKYHKKNTNYKKMDRTKKENQGKKLFDSAITKKLFTKYSIQVVFKITP